MNIAQRLCHQRIISGVFLAIAALAFLGSCSEENPSDPSSTSRAVFDAQHICDIVYFNNLQNNHGRLFTGGISERVGHDEDRS